MLACGPRPNIAFRCVASDMRRGNADTHACVCVQDARISSHTPQFDNSLANHPFFKYALAILRCHLVDVLVPRSGPLELAQVDHILRHLLAPMGTEGHGRSTRW